MDKYTINLDARHIKISEDDKFMLRMITKKKLKSLPVYNYLTEELQDILLSNVLIVATTDNVKRLDNKVDIIIGNIPDAITLVMKDVTENSGKVFDT